MSINQPIQVPKGTRTKPYSNDLIYSANGRNLLVTLSDRQMKALKYTWTKLRLYYVSERYSFTEFAKSFILNGSNEVIQPGEVKLTYEMLKVYLHFI